MSRVIKFRVMDIDGNWHYYTLGDFVCHTPIPAQLRPETWSQFTGLKDANGVEIYEGDITAMHGLDVSYYESGKYCRGVIEFVNGAFLEVFTHDDGSRYFDEINDCDVVGNIYQNPELLK